MFQAVDVWQEMTPSVIVLQDGGFGVCLLSELCVSHVWQLLRFITVL